MKKIIHTENAPAAIGPYSQAVEAGSLIFISGQLPIDPVTGNPVDGSITEQTKRVLENIGAITEAAGASFSQVVKTTIFLKDLRDFPEVNAVYSSFFTSDTPARSTVQVAALPLDVDIEIEAVVVVP